MKILHYILGIPPYRSGGLTAYAVSLMKAQKACGDEVSYLYPGGLSLLHRKITVTRGNTFCGMQGYCIDNAPVVPLLHGVKNPDYILRETAADKAAVKAFIGKVSPDILHVHTFMGLPLSVLQIFKECGVKTVYTTHDYYGLCLRANFIDSAGCVCSSPDRCTECNASAPGKLFLRARNNYTLLSMKSMMRKMRSGGDAAPAAGSLSGHTDGRYKALLSHYGRMFSMIDMFHFNSSNTEKQYRRFMPDVKGRMMHITLGDIADKRRAKSPDPKCVRLTFVGSAAPYKGLPVLCEVLDRLVARGADNWTLDIYGTAALPPYVPDSVKGRTHVRGFFTRDTQDSVYWNTDLLVVPSICNETFGLVVTEALSHGTPVLASSCVGAKDMLASYPGNNVFHTAEELEHLLADALASPERLGALSKAISDGEFPFSMQRHCADMRQLYMSL